MSTRTASLKPLALLAPVAVLATRVCGLAVLAMAFLITLDILVRSTLNTTLLSGGIGEISGYVLAIITAWGASSALLARAHVRIDTLQLLLPRRLGRLADVIAILAFFVASTLLSYVAWSTFSRTAALGSHSMSPLAVPMVIPQGLWFAGLVFLTLVSAAMALAGCAAVLRRDNRAAHSLIGPRSIEEEVEEQTAALGPLGSGASR
jgi:TRAP-type C4-dicarboxylate transport system permease small subunit